MDVLDTIAPTLILAGLLLMSYNVAAHWTLFFSLRRYSPEEFKRIRVLAWLYLFMALAFSIAYLLLLFAMLQGYRATNFEAGLTFFFGAVFVLLGIVLKRRLLAYIRSSYDDLLQAHMALRDDRHRLEEMNAELHEMNCERDAAREADRLKSDFLSLVSHELRTPLTSIYGFTKLIRKDWNAYLYAPLTEAEAERRLQRLDNNLEIISNECNRLTRMVNNLLNLAKIESGQMDWNDQCVSPFSLLKRIFALMQGIIKEQTHLRFVLDVEEDVPDLNVDPDLMIQMVMNLVFNAIKNTEQGEIKVYACRDKDGVQISVSDTGGGISPEHLEMIFDKFQVLSNGDTMINGATGTGLGLAICREIVSHYKGSIWAESEPGQGSTFHVKLPAIVYAETDC